MVDNIIEVKNLCTEFNTENGIVKAVDNVSFDIKRGEIVGIVGESGSGKSVTSLSIMRLIPNPPGRMSGGQILYLHEKNDVIDLNPEKHVIANHIKKTLESIKIGQYPDKHNWLVKI